MACECDDVVVRRPAVLEDLLHGALEGGPGDLVEAGDRLRTRGRREAQEPDRRDNWRGADVLPPRRLVTASHGLARVGTELVQNLGLCSSFAHGPLLSRPAPEVS